MKNQDRTKKGVKVNTTIGMKLQEVNVKCLEFNLLGAAAIVSGPPFVLDPFGTDVTNNYSKIT